MADTITVFHLIQKLRKYGMPLKILFVSQYRNIKENKHYSAAILESKMGF